MLAVRDTVMVVLLSLENLDSPAHVACDELLIGQRIFKKAAGQRLGARTQFGDGIPAGQRLTRIEHPRVPILARVLREVDKRRHQRQIPRQFRRHACAQPLALPVAAVSLPIDPNDRADHGDLAHGPKSEQRMQQMPGVIPAERQRQDCEQHGDGAQHIDRPVAAAVTMPEIDCALIESVMRGGDGGDQRHEPLRRLRRRRCGQCL